MTVLSRGARVRRGGRRPGWLLLTTLLVLAIGASSALVFTDRVELLKLAVILALWAAVVAAFVSVIYRRQSDVDQARVRDLKLVYDLQLDREISARREYELTVESQLRRELASELRAQAADEVAALRTELAALRTNLEILFETELDQRPALETERATMRGYGEWSGSGDSAPADWVASNRVKSVRAETTSGRAEESSIIDVPEEPEPRQPLVDAAEAARDNEASRPPEESQRTEVPPMAADGYPVRESHRGSHWRPADDGPAAQERQDNQAQRHAAHQYEAAPPAEPWVDYRDPRPRSQPEFAPPPQPESPPEPQRPGWYPAAETPRPGAAATERRPVGSDGRWAQSVPRNNWAAPDSDDDSPNTDPGLNGLPPVRQAPPESSEAVQPPEPPVSPTPRRGRHSSPDEAEAARRENAAQQTPSARHSVERADEAGYHTAAAAHPNEVQAAPAPTAEPVARHRSQEAAEDREDDAGPPTGGQSVAELLARFQVEPAGGGRRRRREE